MTCDIKNNSSLSDDNIRQIGKVLGTVEELLTYLRRQNTLYRQKINELEDRVTLLEQKDITMPIVYCDVSTVQRYVIIGGNPFIEYTGTTTFTNLTVVASTDDENALQDLVNLWYDRCAGLLCVFDRVTGAML